VAMKQARIECPHCGGKITIRKIDSADVAPENQAKIWAAADEMFRAIDAGFNKIFHPSLWRS
jgi:uncharacterized Zn finger protein (UPF0148 family)